MPCKPDDLNLTPEPMGKRKKALQKVLSSIHSHNRHVPMLIHTSFTLTCTHHIYFIHKIMLIINIEI